MSVKSQQANMKTIHNLVSQDLGYIHGERESGPNGAKKLFHTKSAAFLRTLGNDLGLKEFKVHKNAGGIAVAGEITLMGLWADGNGVYFQISQNLPGRNDFLYCHITHMKYYSSGSNQWLDSELLKTGDYSAVIDALSALRKSSETSETVNRYAA